MTDIISQFKALHVPGDPLILVNIWDAGSARAVAEAGAKAVATGSWGVACAQGSADGENFPLADALANLTRIRSVTDLPVSIDMEAGYGADAAAVGASVRRAKDAGAAGINMEDRMPGADDLIPLGEAAKRIGAAGDTGLFVNARCDVFRGQKVAKSGDALVAAISNARAPMPTRGRVDCLCPFWPMPTASGRFATPRRCRLISSAIKGGADPQGTRRVGRGTDQPWASTLGRCHGVAERADRTNLGWRRTRLLNDASVCQHEQRHGRMAGRRCDVQKRIIIGQELTRIDANYPISNC